MSRQHHKQPGLSIPQKDRVIKPRIFVDLDFGGVDDRVLSARHAGRRDPDQSLVFGLAVPPPRTPPDGGAGGFEIGFQGGELGG